MTPPDTPLFQLKPLIELPDGVIATNRKVKIIAVASCRVPSQERGVILLSTGELYYVDGADDVSFRAVLLSSISSLEETSVLRMEIMRYTDDDEPKQVAIVRRDGVCFSIEKRGNDWTVIEWQISTERRHMLRGRVTAACFWSRWNGQNFIVLATKLGLLQFVDLRDGNRQTHSFPVRFSRL